MARDTSRHSLSAIPRSRGAFTGLLLLALGAWGALIPFLGTYFHYDYTPTTHWTMTSARFFLEVAPGIVTAVGGLLVLTSGNRFSASAGGYAALAAGAWFLVGPLLAPLFRTGYLGHPTGGKTQVAVEQIGFFFGLGGVIVLLAAFALGRLSVLGVRDVAVAEERALRARRREEAPATADTSTRTRRHRRPTPDGGPAPEPVGDESETVRSEQTP